MNVRLYQKRKKGRPATKLKKVFVTSGGTQVKLSRRNFPIKVKVKSGGTQVKPKKLVKVIVTSGGTQVKVERRGQRNIYQRQVKFRNHRRKLAKRFYKLVFGQFFVPTG